MNFEQKIQQHSLLFRADQFFTRVSSCSLPLLPACFVCIHTLTFFSFCNDLKRVHLLLPSSSVDHRSLPSTCGGKSLIRTFPSRDRRKIWIKVLQQKEGKLYRPNQNFFLQTHGPAHSITSFCLITYLTFVCSFICFMLSIST